MLHEDLEEMMKSKVEKHIEEIAAKKRQEIVKRKSLIENHRQDTSNSLVHALQATI